MGLSSKTLIKSFVNTYVYQCTDTGVYEIMNKFEQEGNADAVTLFVWASEQLEPRFLRRLYF